MLLHPMKLAVLALTACTASVTTETLAYDDRFPEAVLDVVRGDETPATAPVVFYVHGGSWDRGATESRGRRGGARSGER